jgi:hypothetical protein
MHPQAAPQPSGLADRLVGIAEEVCRELDATERWNWPKILFLAFFGLIIARIAEAYARYLAGRLPSQTRRARPAEAANTPPESASHSIDRERPRIVRPRALTSREPAPRDTGDHPGTASEAPRHSAPHAQPRRDRTPSFGTPSFRTRARAGPTGLMRKKPPAATPHLHAVIVAIS